jgi:hypothetical protein
VCVWRNYFAIRDGLFQTVQIVRHFLGVDLYMFWRWSNFPLFIPKSASFPACRVFIQDSDPCNWKRHVHVKTPSITPQLYFRVLKANICCSFITIISRWVEIKTQCGRSGKYSSVGAGVYTFTGHLRHCMKGSVLVYLQDFLSYWQWVKGKGIPLQTLTGPEGSQILWQSAHEGGKVVSRTHRPPLPQGNIPGIHLC